MAGPRRSSREIDDSVAAEDVDKGPRRRSAQAAESSGQNRHARASRLVA